MPLCVFDISEDGTSATPTTNDLNGPARYRWWHFDLADPELPEWSKANLPLIPAEALLQQETRPRCDRYEDGLILNLRGINLNEGQRSEDLVSIRMWITDRAIVTVRVRRVFAIQDIHKATEAGSAPPTPAAFVTDLVTRLTARIQDEVTAVNRRTEFFEAALEDDDAPIPVELTQTRRRVIRLNRYLAPQRAALTDLSKAPLFSANDHLALRELANRITMAVEELDAQRDRLSAVQDDQDLETARKQAANGFLLSVGAGIFLPISFLTGLFGVNVGGMPGIDDPRAFYILCISMTLLSVILVLLIRRLRWL